MLKPEDERAIEDLFARLRHVEDQSGPRDAEAERLIGQRLAENPAAAYYMAQAVIVQEAALQEAQRRLEEAETPRRSGGFLESIFGDNRPQKQSSRHQNAGYGSAGPWGGSPNGDLAGRGGRGSGFLGGAAQAALGVTGGLLLGSALAGLLGGTSAHAAEAPPDDAGIDDMGADGGDFDIGGEF